VKRNSFGPLELEMADLERFLRKTPLGPLGVKHKNKLYILTQLEFYNISKPHQMILIF
jgi:hypothetical protein